MKNEYSYQKSFYFVGACHGKTEKVFLEELANEYFILKLRELNVIRGNDFADAPRIVHFDDELNIQTNELKNKLIIKLEKGDLYKKIASNDEEFKKAKLYFVVIMDINEKDMDQENEKYLIRTNASKVIKDALKEAKIIKDFDNSNLFLGSKFIYFDGSIERHINGLKSGNNKKPARMRKWFGEKEWRTSQDIRDYFSPNKFKKDVTNISEIFDVFDEQINNLVLFLNEG